MVALALHCTGLSSRWIIGAMPTPALTGHPRRCKGRKLPTQVGSPARHLVFTIVTKNNQNNKNTVMHTG